MYIHEAVKKARKKVDNWTGYKHRGRSSAIYRKKAG